MTIEIDHVGLTVSDYAKAKAFYAAAMAPLRVVALMEFPMSDARGASMIVGFGADEKPFFWISEGERTTPHLHIAIRAETRAQVDAFHAAALAAGGTDNGAPGVRETYHPNYYGAFVLDPDGHNIEAVCHMPPAEAKAAKKPARKAAKSPAKRVAAKKTAARKPAAKKVSAKKGAGKKPVRKVLARKTATKRGGR